MANIIMPDYDNSILNIVCSILKHFNIDTPHYPSIDILDEALAKDCTNIVLMVFDGMGIDMLNKNLPPDSFLINNIKREITSVYPCTTTAAMTSYYSGISPNEHGWLGWSLYFKEFGRQIDTFTNRDSYTQTSVGDKNAAVSLMPYKNIFEKLDEASKGEICSYSIMPSNISFSERPNINIKVNNSSEIPAHIKRLCSNKEKKFILSYWPEPDSTMHQLGCYDKRVKSQIEVINFLVEKMCRELKNTLVIVTADHGLTNVSGEVYLNEYPELDECLLMPPSMESRAVSLFVKPWMKEEFKTRFNKRFGASFILYSREDVLEKELFGRATAHKKVADFLGDFLACATGDLMLRYKTLNVVEKPVHLGQHSGLTSDEMLVPLIIV